MELQFTAFSVATLLHKPVLLYKLQGTKFL